MTQTRFLTMLLVGAVHLGCSSPSSGPRGPGNPKLTRYEEADAVADCRRAIARHDFRFLAVAGMTLVFPGIPDFKPRYLHRYRYRIIEGTSEFISGTEDLRLQGVTGAYAARYNRYLLRYLRPHDEA